MKKALHIVFYLYVSLLLSACGRNSNIKGDVSVSLDAIISGNTDEGYIYNVDLAGNKTSLMGEDALIRKICSKTTYKITKIHKLNEEEATATIKITSPDIIQMMNSILESNTIKDASDLLSYLESELDSKVPSKEFSIDLSLVLVDAHWFVIPNSELINAFSGGLVKEYSIIERQTVEQLIQRGE